MAAWHHRFEEVVAETEGLRSPADIREEELKKLITDSLIDEIIEKANEIHATDPFKDGAVMPSSYGSAAQDLFNLHGIDVYEK